MKGMKQGRWVGPRLLLVALLAAFLVTPAWAGEPPRVEPGRG